MGTEDDGGAVRDLVQLFYKYRAFADQVVYHVTVVDDFVTHIDGCGKYFQGTFYDLDGTVYTGTEPAWIGEVDIHHLFHSDLGMCIVDPQYVDSENDLLSGKRVIEVNPGGIVFYAQNCARDFTVFGGFE